MVDRLPYWLAVPEGWHRIPLDIATSGSDPAGTAVRDLVRSVGRELPPHQATRARSIVRAALDSAVAQARGAGGVDLYVPLDLVAGAPVPLGIVVSEPVPPAGSGTPEDVLLRFAARGESRATEIGGVLAVRRVSDEKPRTGPDGIDVPPTRRISYLAAVPGTSRWLSVTASIARFDMPDGERVSAAVEELFDAIASTLRFRRYARDHGADQGSSARKAESRS